MCFVAVLDVVENDFGFLHRGRLYDDFLESAFECSVLLDALTILIEGCCTDTLEFASCQCGLHHVGSIHLSSLIAGTYEVVNLIDEDDDVGILFQFVDDGTHALLELSAIFCSCYDGRHVE